MHPPRLTTRLAGPGDEAVLRDLRIQALSDSPAAFGSTLGREHARTEADWTKWLTTSATYLLEADDHPCGLAAGVPDAADDALAWLMAMWVHPRARGTGASRLLVEAVLSWAGEVGAERIRLEVVDGNHPALRLYTRYGFRPTGHTKVRPRDGATEIVMELRLRP